MLFELRLLELPEYLSVRLAELLEQPSQETWERAYGLIVKGHEDPLAPGAICLWQAVQDIDPAFPKLRKLDEPWPRVPDRETIERALAYAWNESE